MEHIATVLTRAFNFASPTEEAPGCANSRGHIDPQTQPLSASSDTDRKCLATLTAKLAIRGYGLRCSPEGSFAVSRWNLLRLLPDLAAVRSFLELVEGAHHG